MAELFYTKYKNHYEPRVRHQQKFDKKKIHIIKCGKKINVYDAIQEANQDTDIYKTLEKYGTIDNMYRHNKEAILEDFEDYMNLHDLHQLQEKAKNMWENLPAGVREQFQNDRLKFLENGEKWLKNGIAKEKEKNKKNEKEVEKNEK